MKDHYGFGKNLRKIMNALGMDQTELAKKSGLTQAAVSQLLAGLRDPSLHTLVRIMRVIPVKFETLINVPDAPLKGKE
jgi:transcriptional regulator with XRE-family HTH domain